MKRVILTLLVIFAATSIVHSQTILRGTVTDTSTGKAVEFASVSVKGKNSNFFDGATTDAQGYYTVGNLPNDTLSISVSCTGYEEHIKIIVCHGNNETINIDFAISNAVTNLGEVSVEAMRSQMRMELDKKVFDVSASTIAEGASVADILNDIPSVELTAEGTISLRGSESVIIWINGKPSGLDAENQTQILEQLPAESIERVEVITNPSSKYSPEGTAGIINIVLKEKRKAGYYGSCSGRYQLSPRIQCKWQYLLQQQQNRPLRLSRLFESCDDIRKHNLTQDRRRRLRHSLSELRRQHTRKRTQHLHKARRNVSSHIERRYIAVGIRYVR